MLRATPILLVLLAAIIPLRGQAESVQTSATLPLIKECQAKFTARIDYSRCLDAALQTTERDLKAWERNIEFKLAETFAGTGRVDAISVFKSTAKSFLSYRDKHCQWQYLAMLPDVSSAAILAKECKIVMSSERISNLKEVSAFNF